MPGKTRCRFHGGCSTGAITEDGKARSLAAMHDGWQRWLEETRAKKAAGEIDRFPGGRKSGPRWVTPRMWERQQIETMQRLRAEREALEPRPPRRRRGRPTIIARAQAQILRSLAQPLPPTVKVTTVPLPTWLTPSSTSGNVPSSDPKLNN